MLKPSFCWNDKTISLNCSFSTLAKLQGALLTLSLFVALVFRTNYHNFAVSFNNFALVTHRFY